jgi:protein TonB
MAILGSKLDILKTEWLDVVFSGRNKEYGAYQLRKNNSRNMLYAFLITVGLFVAVVSIPTIINMIKGFIPKAPDKVKIQEVPLLPPPPINKTEPPPPPPPPTPEPQKPRVDQVRFPPPIVKPDEQVREKDPPTQEDLKTADPGQKDIKGDPTQTVRIDEPVGNAPVSKAVVEEAPSNEIFTSVEVTPEFPGGMDKFYAYLGKAIRYPAVARENNVSGRVIVTFVVERDGSLTDVKALRGPGSGLEEEAVRAVKSSPHWRPGKQNGRDVRVQYTVPVVFTLQDQ